MIDPDMTDKEHIKKELRKLFRSMDFVSNKFLVLP